MYERPGYIYHWIFDGTNMAAWVVNENGTLDTFTCEIKLENDHLWVRLWNNPFSNWEDRGAYSFSSGNLILKGITHIKEDSP
jgi:hypothetical protein